MPKYTDSQIEAIESRNRNLLILACAGSGKTEVISYRIAQLVREGINRDEIIAFTFTDRAANELKARVRLHLGEALPDNPSLGDMYIGTIHSFCLRMLKEIDPDYRKYEVMDEASQAALISTNYHYFPESNRGIGLNNLRSQHRTGGYWSTLQTFITTLSIIYQNNIDINTIQNLNTHNAVKRYQEIAYGYPNYFFDFDRIISLLIARLTESPSELEVLRSRFQYLIVDEYQDVDDHQAQLIRILSDDGRRMWVTAVGDDDQAIYGWRGARVDNILTFKNIYHDTKEVKLTYNFRSTHAIVEVATSAIRRIPSNNRFSKPMEARHYDEEDDRFIETMADYEDVQLRKFSSEEDEAIWISERIKQLRGTVITEPDGNERAIDYSDIAVIFRSVRSSGSIYVKIFEEKRIPFVVKGIGGLFDHKEILLIHAAFSLLARSQFRVGSEVYDELETREFIRNSIRSLKQSNKISEAKDDLFLEWIASKREELDKRNLEKRRRGRLARRIYPQDIFQEMLNVLGISKGSKPWPQATLFNLGRLSNLIMKFESVHQWITPNDLPYLVNFLGGWAAGQIDEGRLDETGTPNAVQVLTVHAAKGLEWPVVFLARVSSANFPSNLRNRGPDTFLDEQIFDPTNYITGDIGERRLWYVATTRCQKFLNITSPDRPRKRPSAFFKEIHHDYIQQEGEITERKKDKPSHSENLELFPTNFTDLNSYWRCPFEYQLRALMGFSPGVKEQYGYGQQIHNILSEMHESAIKGNILSKEEAMNLVENRFHLRYTRDGEEYKPFTALKDAAKKSLERYLEEYPDNTKYVLEAEKPFEYIDRSSKALISGTVDLLERIEQIDETQVFKPVAVIDFKTHNWRDYDQFNSSKVQAERQLRLYSLAVGEALGFDVKTARVHFLAPGPILDTLIQKGASDTISIDVSEDKINEMKNQVQKTINDIWNSINTGLFQFTGCNNGSCRNCDFRNICPGYKKWDQLDRTTPRSLDLEESRSEEIAFIEEDINAGS